MSELPPEPDFEPPDERVHVVGRDVETGELVVETGILIVITELFDRDEPE